MKIAKETWALLAIGLIDLVTTIIFIRNHNADEANPLFKNYWEMGIAAFITAKIVMLVGPLAVLEWARGRNPKFVSWALRSTIAAYLILYSAGFFKLNSTTAEAEELARERARADETTVVAAKSDLLQYVAEPPVSKGGRYLRLNRTRFDGTRRTPASR